MRKRLSIAVRWACFAVCAAIALSSLLAPRWALVYYTTQHTFFILGDVHADYRYTFGPASELRSLVSISSAFTLPGWQCQNIASWSDHSWWDNALALPAFQYGARSPVFPNLRNVRIVIPYSLPF